MSRIVSLSLLALMVAPLFAQADTPAATSSNDRSRSFYMRQAPDGSTVLGNGDLEAGAVPLRLQAPAVVGGDNLNPRNARPGTEGVMAAMSGNAPTTNYTSSAVREDLKARDEKIATRVTQMFHRNHALKDPTQAAAAAPAH